MGNDQLRSLGLLAVATMIFGCVEREPEEVLEERVGEAAQTAGGQVSQTLLNGERVVATGYTPSLSYQLEAYEGGTKKAPGSFMYFQYDYRDPDTYRCETHTYCWQECCEWRFDPDACGPTPGCEDGSVVCGGGEYCFEGRCCSPTDPTCPPCGGGWEWYCGPELCHEECNSWEECYFARGGYGYGQARLPEGSLKATNAFARLAFSFGQVSWDWYWGCTWDRDASFYECGYPSGLGDVDLTFRPNGGASFSISGTQTETYPTQTCDWVCDSGGCQWTCTNGSVTTRLTGVINRSDATFEGTAFGQTLDEPRGGFFESGLNVIVERTRY